MICSLILFPNAPVLLGLFVGMACVLMVSFDAHYRHLGRAFATRKKRYILGFPIFALVLILGSFVWGTRASVALLLLIVISYGLTPSFVHMKQVLGYGDGNSV